MSPTLRNWQPPTSPDEAELTPDAVADCGWGKLAFAHTFHDQKKLIEFFRKEAPAERNIAFYMRDPHVLLSMAPQELFLDPSHTFRLWLDQYRPARTAPRGFTIRRAAPDDEAEINRLLVSRQMVPLRKGYMEANRGARETALLVAIAEEGGDILGFCMGVDHKRVFGDPEKGTSLWSLVVDRQASLPGIGETLSRHLIEIFIGRGRAFMDLSVMHDNEKAISLYERLGFRRVPVFALKGKNSINEKLFTPPQDDQADLNPYARIIVDEAMRRGISVDVVDGANGYFKLIHGAREIICRESLSELTSAVAMSRCDDKTVTRRVLEEAGLRVPRQTVVEDEAQVAKFLEETPRVVVKPARGEQGAGITVDIGGLENVMPAIEAARRIDDKVILEEFVEGHDMRIVVIGDEVVAAAIRRPATVRGNGRDTVATLIEKTSKRRSSVTGGESRIPMDDETRRCVIDTGHDMDSVLEDGAELQVRKTANLHTGGTIHDVTDKLHPDLAAAAVAGARALAIPVVGFDFLVRSPEEPDYVVIEANERPGLANHEPQPTAERFVDLLFPQTSLRSVRKAKETQNPEVQPTP